MNLDGNINGAPSIPRALVRRVHVDLIISMRGFLTMARCLNGSSGPNIIDSNERQANARLDERPGCCWRVSSADKGSGGYCEWDWGWKWKVKLRLVL